MKAAVKDAVYVCSRATGMCGGPEVINPIILRTCSFLPVHSHILSVSTTTDVVVLQVHCLQALSLLQLFAKPMGIA
jgi:hypothetical protein